LPSIMLVGEAPVMIGPGDEMAAGTAGRGRLRASDADREQVIGTLKAVFVQGLLDKDEFELRVGQAFASRTYAELAAVTAGIPARPDPAPPPRPARAQAQRPVLRPGRVITAASALYAGVWAFVFLFPMGADNKATFLLFWTSALICLGVWMVADLLVCHRRPRPRRRRRTSRPRSLVHHQGPALDR
jgi:hypothetical protein